MAKLDALGHILLEWLVSKLKGRSAWRPETVRELQRCP